MTTIPAMLAQAYIHDIDPFILEVPQQWAGDPGVLMWILVPLGVAWWIGPTLIKGWEQSRLWQGIDLAAILMLAGAFMWLSGGVRWYPMAYLCGFVLSWPVMRRMAASGRCQLKPGQAWDLVLACVWGVLLGGRLGYAIFYDQSLWTTLTADPPWWELLAFHHGGMASHGGIIGAAVAMWLWGRRNNISPLHLMDLGALTCPIGLGLGRCANFINAELWGRAIPEHTQAYAPWWSVKYPEEINEWLFSGDDRLAALEPLRLEVAGGSTFHEQVILAMRSGNTAVIEHVGPLLTAWYPSQLFQAITDGPLLLVAMMIAWWTPRKPGIVAGWFLVVYGALRLSTEAFRQPDIGVAMIAGLSRGQQLSILMAGIGLVMVFLCARRDVARLGGVRPSG